MGNTPQHPPQRRTLDSWSKPHSSPPNWKAEREWRGGGGREGSPFRVASLKASEGEECLPPARAALKLPANSRSHVPSCSPPPASSHSDLSTPQGQAFSHLSIFPHTPTAPSTWDTAAPSPRPESYFPSGVLSDPPQRAEVHPLGDLTAPFASPPQVVLLFLSGPSHFLLPAQFPKGRDPCLSYSPWFSQCLAQSLGTNKHMNSEWVNERMKAWMNEF